MAYKLRNRQVFRAEVNGKNYTFTCYTQSTSYGFRHICCDGFSNTDVCRYVKDDIIARASYFNRTYERFEYETVLKNGIKNIAPDKETEQALKDILIEKKAQADHEQCEKEIKAFEALYNQISDTFKDAVKNTGFMMHSEDDVNLVKGLMALDILLNK